MNNNLNKQVYQIYVKSFFDTDGDGWGDLRGIIEKLDYIKSLGTDIIWLSPIFPSGGADNGYDVSDYCMIDRKYGALADFDRLISESEKREMSIMLDIVVNHSSDKHEWFSESRKSRDNPKRDFYIWRDGKDGSPPNNWFSLFGTGSAWKLDEPSGQYYLHLFSENQPDLNWENPELRGEIYKLMNFWLERGVKGFRLDVITYISKPSDFSDAENGDPRPYVSGGAKITEYLRKLRQRVFANGAELVIGEAAGAGKDDALRYAPLSGELLDAIFQFEQNGLDGREYGIWDDITIEPRQFAETLFSWQEHTDGSANLALYLSNHDQPRAVERYFPASVKYCGGKTYDTAAKTLAMFMYFMRGTPVIYNGDELGLRNAVIGSRADIRDIETLTAFDTLTACSGEDEALRKINKKSRDVSRAMMTWNETEEARSWTVAKPADPLRTVQNQEHDPESVLNFYRKMLRLRKELLPVLYGSFGRVETDSDNVFAYFREYGGKRLYIVCNFGDTAESVRLYGKRVILNAGTISTNKTLTLGAFSGVVLE